jgi:hypothetical protein
VHPLSIDRMNKMMHRYFFCLVVLIGFQCLHAQGLYNIAGKREIFVDRHLIASMDGMRLVAKDPVDEGEVFAFDRPWEGAFSGYATVLQDQGLLRMYYRGLPDAGRDGSSLEVTCYAESKDGVHWIKPDLDLFPLPDHPLNNIILTGEAPASHNFCPFIDTHPDAHSRQRYKALAGISSSGLLAFVSEDGIRWTKLMDAPVFKPEGWVLDSQNVPFWSEAESKYVLYYRSAVNGVRSIARATSSNFTHWETEGQMIYSDTRTTEPSHHLYTNQTQPYFRAPHIYLATAARFLPGRKVLTDEQAEAIQVHPKYFNDTSDSVLMSSRGGLEYDRTFLSALIRPGIGAKNWVSRSNYPALGLAQTGGASMSLFVNQDYGQPSAHMHRYGFRLDGLSCLSAGYEEGEWVSHPLQWNGDRLYFNFSTSAAGYIKVELEHANGVPIAGYTLHDATELIGNEIERVYRWAKGEVIELDRSQPIRLRVRMKDAELYALRFGD